MNLAATHNTPASPIKVKPVVKVEFLDPANGKLVTRFVNLATPPDVRSLNRLMIWAAHKEVELRIRPNL